MIGHRNMSKKGYVIEFFAYLYFLDTNYHILSAPTANSSSNGDLSILELLAL